MDKSALSFDVVVVIKGAFSLKRGWVLVSKKRILVRYSLFLIQIIFMSSPILYNECLPSCWENIMVTLHNAITNRALKY